MNQQLEHSEHLSGLKKFPVTLLLDNVSGPANIGSIFRLADAFNIQKIIICGKNLDLSSSRLQKTARSTTKNVAFEVFENAKEAIKAYDAKKVFTIFALEITDISQSLHSMDFSEIKNLMLIVGSENFGVNADLLKMTQGQIHINMFGHNSSMNVAQATGIALYEITKTINPLAAN